MLLLNQTPAVLVGMAIGDALGMPFERPDESAHELLEGWDGEFREGTQHELPAGHWTDDTEMAVALTESLIEMRGFDPASVAAHYLAWSEATPHGMGGTTRKAMKALKEGRSWEQSGVLFDNPKAVGNGTVMRCAPLGVLFNMHQWESLACCLRTDAEITHRDAEAVAASQAVGFLVTALIDSTNGMTPSDMITFAWRASMRSLPETGVSRALEKALWLLTKDLSPQDAIAVLGRRGNAAQTTASAVYCAACHGLDYIGGVRAAVRGGGDTDTRGAITGAILGAWNGLLNIPIQLHEKLRDGLRLVELDKQLWALRGKP